MNRSFIFRTLLTAIFILALLPVTQAKVPEKSVFLTDTAGYKRQDEKKDKNKQKTAPKEKTDQQLPDKPDIIEVPKARRQSRPPVIKPNVKAKPIKVIRPNIKRP